jgi:hypothetical protein
MKKFDAVQTVRDIRDKIYEQTKSYSDVELIEHYRKIAEEAKAVQENSAEYHPN